MAIKATHIFNSLFHSRHFLPNKTFFCTLTSPQTLQQAIKNAVQAKSYKQIPDILVSHKVCGKNPNPFSFLSAFSQSLKTHVIDEILQSLMPVRPRFRTYIAYSCLLSYTLQSSNPLPISFPILQCMLRSGSLPVLQTRLFLVSAWLAKRQQPESVASVLVEMKSIGYDPDCGICNYLIESLCAVDHLGEAVKVLKGMAGAGCIPDLESYGGVISAMCAARKSAVAVELMKEMVVQMGLTPRQGTVVKVMAALRANRELWKGVEMIEFLEKEGCLVGFEGYQSVLEGCLECKEYILAGKVVMGMTDKGFIPYIKVRQKVVEELAGVGEWKLACAVRQRFTELSS